MNTTRLIIGVRGGIAEIAEISVPRGIRVSVTIRDYDTDGVDPEKLRLDPDGVPCFESEKDYG